MREGVQYMQRVDHEIDKSVVDSAPDGPESSLKNQGGRDDDASA
jgi:hypothetical protein